MAEAPQNEQTRARQKQTKERNNKMQSSRNEGKATLYKKPGRPQPMSERSHTDVSKIKKERNAIQSAATCLNPLDSIPPIDTIKRHKRYKKGIGENIEMLNLTAKVPAKKQTPFGTHECSGSHLSEPLDIRDKNSVHYNNMQGKTKP